MKKIIIPTKIDIEAIKIIANGKYLDTTTNNFKPYLFGLESINIEACYYILYLILKETLYKINTLKDKSKYITNGAITYNNIFVQLHSKQLEGIDRNYKKIMSFLCNKHTNFDNILFRTNYENKKAYGYCINYNYINSQFKIIEITKRSILKRLNSECNLKINDSIINKTLKQIKIDFSRNVLLDTKNMDNQLPCINIVAEYISLINLLDFHNDKKWMSINKETDGRLHHNITNMKSIHRKYLRTNNGEQFIEIDISSCIPLLFVVSIFSTYKDHKVTNLSSDLIKYRKLFEVVFEDLSDLAKRLFEAEIKDILDSILTNKFYDLMINNAEFNKGEILSYFFRKNNSYVQLENHIKNRFPNFHYLVCKMKDNDTWVESYKAPPYIDCNKLLAYYLFHLESELMLYNVVPEIKKINKKITVITIHDCVLVPYQFKDVVINTINNVFESIIKVKPNIKIKTL